MVDLFIMRKMISLCLCVLIATLVLEILVYTFFGGRFGLVSGLPSFSDLFAPIHLNSRYIQQADGEKTLYANRLGGFTQDLNSFLSSESSFVKTAEADYVLGGTVAKIVAVGNAGSFGGIPAYDITLRNSQSRYLVLHLSSGEAQYLKVFTNTSTLSDGPLGNSRIDDVKVGDYIAVRKSTNLLNPSEVNLEIDILSPSQ